MRILFVNETFWPDHVATAQYLHDAAACCAGRGHEVVVLCSRYGYSDFSKRYPKEDKIDGVRVLRVGYPHLPHRTAWARAWNMVGLLVALWIKGLRLGRFDRIVALSSPPFVVCAVAFWAKINKIPLIYWLMDLNPDEAAAVGWLSEKNPIYRALDAAHRKAMKFCHRVITLDEDMRGRVLAKGVPEARVIVRSLWPIMDEGSRVEILRFAQNDNNVDAQNDNNVDAQNDNNVDAQNDNNVDAQNDNNVDAQNDNNVDAQNDNNVDAQNDGGGEDAGTGRKFVLLYSGNLSLCHPVDTFLQAAREMSGNAEVEFRFVGGGERIKEAEEFKRRHNLANIRCAPYVRREDLGRLIREADLLLVAMGDTMKGIVHPSKIYDMIASGKPCLGVGPADSFIARWIRESGAGLTVAHGDTRAFAASVDAERTRPADERLKRSARQVQWARTHMDRARNLDALVLEIES